MELAHGLLPIVPEDCVKRLSAAVWLVVLAPALALAEPAPVEAETPASTSDSPKATATSADEAAATVETAGGASAQESALASAVQARTPEAQALQSGFQFIVEVDHSLGAGTFVDSSLYSYLEASLAVLPQYLFSIGGQRLVASLMGRMSYEYTLPDTETGRKVSWYDTRLSLSAPALFRDKAITGIAFSPSASLSIPTSLESWNAGLITGLSLGLTMSRSVKTVDFRLSLGGSRSFFTSAQTGMRATDERDASGNRLAICRSGETICGFGAMNPAWSFNVGGQVQWAATGHLLFIASYSYSRSWKHAAASDDDEFTAKAVDSNGQRAAHSGAGQSDRTSTYLGASYQMNEHYSIDLGVSTSQAPLTPTGGVRFPFLSLGTWADNNTTIGFALSAAY